MIIALESASTDPSLALVQVDGTPIAADGWTSDGRQASDLLPRLLALLVREGRTLEQATAVAVGTGPGSFTGLRVGMSVAKGLALGRGDATAQIVARDDLAREVGPALVVVPTELAVAFGIARWRPPLRAALTVGTQASLRLAADPAGDDLESLEPGYLRQPRV